MMSSSCSTTNSELPGAFSGRARAAALRYPRDAARGRLVEHVDDAEQVRAHLRGEPQPLQLAGRQRRRAALEREVAEPEVQHDREPRAQVLAMRRVDVRLLGMLALELAQDFAVPSANGRKSSPSFFSGTRDISAMSSPRT
jgi:hypothetical protein